MSYKHAHTIYCSYTNNACTYGDFHVIIYYITHCIRSECSNFLCHIFQVFPKQLWFLVTGLEQYQLGSLCTYRMDFIVDKICVC